MIILMISMNSSCKIQVFVHAHAIKKKQRMRLKRKDTPVFLENPPGKIRSTTVAETKSRADCVLPANFSVVSPSRQQANACLAALCMVAISYLCLRYYHILRPVGSRILTLCPGATAVFLPPISISLPDSIARDLVAVHRSVENENTSCTGILLVIRALPYRDRYTFYAFSTLRFSSQHWIFQPASAESMSPFRREARNAVEPQEAARSSFESSSRKNRPGELT